jgi:hypothetical protein
MFATTDESNKKAARFRQRKTIIPPLPTTLLSSLKLLTNKLSEDFNCANVDPLQKHRRDLFVGDNSFIK